MTISSNFFGNALSFAHPPAYRGAMTSRSTDFSSDPNYALAQQQMALQRYLADQANAGRAAGQWYDAAAHDSGLANQRALAGQREAGESSRLGLTLQNALDRDRLQGDTARSVAGINADASRYPHDLRQNRFNTIFPWMRDQMGNIQNQFNSGAFTAGGQSGAGPSINASPIWGENLIQQQVNAARSGNDQAMSGRIARAQEQLGARGFGANSPLAQAIQAQYQGQNMGANTSNEREIRWNAATGNAKHLLDAQRAQEEQYASRMQEDIERRRPYISGQFGLMNSLLGAMAGLV